MRNYRSRAIILRRYNIGEADRILTAISPELGKARYKVRGVRKGGSKLAGHLELFCETELQLARGHQLDVITGAALVKTYDFDRSELNRVGLAYLLLEMTDKLTVEQMPSRSFYRLLDEALTTLSDGCDEQLLRHYFFIKALCVLGQAPNLTNLLVSQKYYLNYNDGRIESTLSANSELVDIKVIKLWRLIYAADFGRVRQVRGTVEILPAAQELIEKFYEYHIGRRFYSEQVVSR